MFQYTKTATAAPPIGSVHPEDVENPLFVHLCSLHNIIASAVPAVAPKRDGKALGFLVAWDSRSFYTGPGRAL